MSKVNTIGIAIIGHALQSAQGKIDSHSNRNRFTYVGRNIPKVETVQYEPIHTKTYKPNTGLRIGSYNSQSKNKVR